MLEKCLLFQEILSNKVNGLCLYKILPTKKETFVNLSICDIMVYISYWKVDCYVKILS